MAPSDAHAAKADLKDLMDYEKEYFYKSLLTFFGMDGTAMYIALLTMFSVQAFGVELQPMQYLIIAGMTTIVAMGVAPVPSGSLFVFAAVLGAIGIPVEQAALVVGLILPFDRPLDMMRTVPNVTCDLAVATVVARSEGEIDVAEYKSAKDI